ncbi:MAG: tRNA uridine(34) 5-carboxymethylaminomethyl modification radical SAM/GNAT enzyme Elp3 [Candidatus Falkowbacteria bacterium]|nr:tRNA uridine(34) 5-carboxymethylaminomethyl modification radical SAM/GNAT enzyme Elp3 [Candidatus Falkowbacteria bacterium]
MEESKRKLNSLRQLIDKYGQTIKDGDQLSAAKRAICKEYALDFILNSELLAIIKKMPKKEMANFSKLSSVLKKRAVRTMSGIAPVAVLTKPYPCPGNCAYCPNEKDVPTSYLSNEPAVMRAIMCAYDPYRQVITRLGSLENNGHEPNKIELIVIGGTWSYLPEKYQYWYILNCFKAANDFSKIKKNLIVVKKLNAPYKKSLSLVALKKSLAAEQKKNEGAKYRLIGVTLETRPDYLNEEELLRMRDLGCTRVEIGVQAVDDEILKKNKRGHLVDAITRGTALLRDFGFKITYHIMPALPGSTPKRDFEMFQELFNDSRFQPDQIKFYPTVVTEGSLLYRWWKKGLYQPYSDQELKDLIIACKKIVPKYVRIIRLIRDIPGESIIAGNKITNLRQIMKQEGVACHCIRCREAHQEIPDQKKIKINLEKYPAGQGVDYFISADSLDGNTLFGFCRLSINPRSPISSAIIRELHVYGELVPIGGESKIQHTGLGKILLKEAENIATQNKVKNISVISGIGARNYYRKFGYRPGKGKASTYLNKKLA